MKKILAVLAAAAALTGSVYASPLTQWKDGETEINLTMWDSETETSRYSSDGEWNFGGGITYGITDKWAAQYQYTGISTDHTNGTIHEINGLYSFHPQVAGFVGLQHISLSDFPNRAFGSSDQTNNVLQAGVIARQPLTDGLDLYAKGGIGTESTSMWEAGVDLALDKNLDLNAGYRYLNTKGDSSRNVSYKGFMAGVSYRFGGKDPEDLSYMDSTEEPNYDYEAGTEEDASTVTVISDDAAADTVSVPADTPVAAPENDYYFQSVHFDSDSAAIPDSQKPNLDAFIKQAKETGHTFKLVGRADISGDSEYNRQLSEKRIEAVKKYAMDQGVKESQMVAMIKGSDDVSGTAVNAADRRVDIFEHK